jgi:hypothetical protein
MLSAEFLRAHAKKDIQLHFGFGTSFRSQNPSHAAQVALSQKLEGF